jgi:hypothetical protein
MDDFGIIMASQTRLEQGGVTLQYLYFNNGSMNNAFGMGELQDPVYGRESQTVIVIRTATAAGIHWTPLIHPRIRRQKPDKRGLHVPSMHVLLNRT